MTMATIENSFLQTIAPVTHDLGAFKVHRTLPSKQRTMVGPFIFVDEFGPARLPPGGMDVRPPPHQPAGPWPILFDGASNLATDQLARRDRARRGQSDDRGKGHYIPSARRPTSARRASLYSMQTGSTPDGKARPTSVDHVAADGLPLIEDSGASARVPRGPCGGSDRGDPAAFADLRRYQRRRGSID
jgi:redox-sensitive bicupin YhaK (pirin superfamily)